MENQKIIAIMIAALAAILVIVAGKSCTANVDSKKRTASSGKASSNVSVSIVQGTVQNNNGVSNDSSYSDIQNVPQEYPTQPEIQYVTDLLGRVIGTVAPEDITHVYIEYHTDLLGRVVGSEAHLVTEGTTETPTHVEYVTDLLGRVIGTEIVTGEKEPDTEPTTNKKERPKPTAGKNKNEGNGSAPSSIHIVIN